MASIWTPERVEAANALFNLGASASEMSADLSRKFGFSVSRNAIISLWHRKGWTGGKRRLTTQRRDAVPRKAAALAKRERVKIEEAPAPATPPKVRKVQRVVAAAKGFRVINATEQDMRPLRQVAVEPLHLNLLDLQHGQCRYPFGDGPFTFCGCRTVPDSPYCEPHQELCSGKHIISGRAAVEERKRKYARMHRAAA